MPNVTVAYAYDENSSRIVAAGHQGKTRVMKPGEKNEPTLIVSSDHCLTVAFYGPKLSDSDRPTILEWGLDIIQQVQSGQVWFAFSTDSCSITKKPIEKQIRTWERKKSEPLRSIELTAFPSDIIPKNDWHASLAFHQNEYVALSFLCSLPDSFPSIIKAAEYILEKLKPTYGIGYLRSRNLGPIYYAVGVGKELRPWIPEEDAELKSMTSWAMRGMPMRVYEQGLLRDVYPLNYLNQTHLSRQIITEQKPIPLEQWILQDSSRGTLTPLSSCISLWRVPIASMDSVRSVIKENGIVFHCC